jgi:hypothetical protein
LFTVTLYAAARPVLLLSFAVDSAAMVLALPKALFPEAGVRFGGGPRLGDLRDYDAEGAGRPKSR